MILRSIHKYRRNDQTSIAHEYSGDMEYDNNKKKWKVTMSIVVNNHKDGAGIVVL